MSSPGDSRRTIARRRETALFLLAVPALLLLGIIFAWPVLRLLAMSVEDGTLANFEKATLDELYLYVLFDSVKIAAMVMAICLVVAYPVAFWLSRAGRWGVALGMFALLLPFWTSVLVRTYAWLVLLGRNGVVNRWLRDAGLIEAPLPLLHNTSGVLIGMVHVLLPYMVFPIYASLLRIDPDLSRAAEGLGAPAWRSFLRVTFPLSLPGVSAGCALVFVLSLGFFITPALLGGGRVIMVSMLIEQQVREFLDWPFAAALSTVLLVATLAIYALIGRITRGARHA
ncbi:ABC transporter permease [Neoroseomonas oryzicola]|uniref:ABC transporter permease n=1 Tax=Neoroseomonas oryzicola TaxID=535904 RepID=A0A9X9WHL2_9PROT|nr:ABC transporter permease [Neoroseomonas oryzicola]MBR0659822.1 ABC transporter permease [Neoroseomonas oryzicola]NKE19526.1 ABC transporter permease [Neoroseomonas oryzicola]